MANPNAPFGFRPWKAGSGGATARVNSYAIPTAYGTNLFYGDTVKVTGTGVQGKPSINISTANTDQIVGIFCGCRYTASDGSFVFRRNWIASTAEKSGTLIEALVWDDPNQLFVAQCDGTTVVTDISAWAGVVTTTAGSATTGLSGQQISTGQGSETTFKIMELIGAAHEYPCRNAAGSPDYFTVGANGLAVVKIMKHENGPVASVES